MNDNPTTDREISKDMTAEPIESDATEKKRQSCTILIPTYILFYLYRGPKYVGS
jgi:hypothetical protein